MNNIQVINFLESLTHQVEVRADLRSKSKQEVLSYAAEKGFDFSEQDFDDTIWGFEIELAGQLNEKFDLSFSLWETMWGRYYLDYLIDNLVAVHAIVKK